MIVVDDVLKVWHCLVALIKHGRASGAGSRSLVHYGVNVSDVQVQPGGVLLASSSD